MGKPSSGHERPRKRKPSKKEPARKASARKEAAQKEAAQREAAKKEPARKEPLPARGNSLPQGNRRETPARTAAVAGPPARGRYVYCIIQSSKPLKLGQSTIADEGAHVYTVNYKDLAAVVSDVPIGALDSTRENVLAHEHVNETVMRDHTVIPMSFGTIFKTREDIVELLRSAYDAFGDVLSKMQNKLEFGLKVLWDRDAIVKEIEQEDEEIHRLKTEISSQKGST